MLLSIAGEAVLSACERACSLIDMNAHEGTHPCMGAVDLVPIYPLGEEVGLEDCGKEAQGMWSCMHRRKVKMYSQNAFSLFFFSNVNVSCSCLYVPQLLFSFFFSISNSSDRTSGRYQCFFVWLGRFSSASRSGSKEEGDWLVQKGQRYVKHPARCGYTAHKEIRHYRLFFKCAFTI